MLSNGYKYKYKSSFEPRHEKKNNIMSVRPAKTQISLGIRPIWSESSLCIQWVAKDPSFLSVDSKDSDQTRRMHGLIWVFAERTVHFVGLSCGGSFFCPPSLCRRRRADLSSWYSLVVLYYNIMLCYPVKGTQLCSCCLAGKQDIYWIGFVSQAPNKRARYQLVASKTIHRTMMM